MDASSAVVSVVSRYQASNSTLQSSNMCLCNYFNNTKSKQSVMYRFGSIPLSRFDRTNKYYLLMQTAAPLMAVSSRLLFEFSHCYQIGLFKPYSKMKKMIKSTSKSKENTPNKQSFMSQEDRTFTLENWDIPFPSSSSTSPPSPLVMH